MAKRFTDTNKYKKPFIRGLQGAYKLLWDYLYHECDHAGIWIVDFEIAQIYLGSDMKVNKSDALKYFNTDEIRVIEINSGSKWFLPSFIDFQYGLLSENNRAHNSVIIILKKYKLINDKGLIRGLQACKDKDKDKELDKDKEANEIYFLYPSSCKFQNNRSTGKTKKDKDKIKKLLKENTKEDLISRIKSYIYECDRTQTYYKNFTTFLNNLPEIVEIKIEVDSNGRERPSKQHILVSNNGITNWALL